MFKRDPIEFAKRVEEWFDSLSDEWWDAWFDGRDPFAIEAAKATQPVVPSFPLVSTDPIRKSFLALPFNFSTLAMPTTQNGAPPKPVVVNDSHVPNPRTGNLLANDFSQNDFSDPDYSRAA